MYVIQTKVMTASQGAQLGLPGRIVPITQKGRLRLVIRELLSFMRRQWLMLKK